MSRAEVVDNKSRLNFGPVQAREIAIRKSKFGEGPWRILLEVRALGAAKNGSLRFPSAGSVDDPSGWAPVAFAAASTAPAGATVMSIDSRALSGRREIWIDAPAHCNPAQRCDVLIVLDAHALFPLATAHAAVMRAMGRMTPLIIVGIPSLSTDDRLRNFTASVTDADKARYAAAGGAARFTEFLQQEVMPMVTSRFPVSERRVLAGHSLAGLYAVNALPAGVISEAIAISPTLGWNGDEARQNVQRWLQRASPGPTRLYVSVADGDTEVYRSSFDRFEQLVSSARQTGLQSSFARRTQEDHVTTVAPALQQAMLQFFARPAG